VSSSGMRSVGSTKHKQATLVSSLFHTVDTGICKEVQGLSAWTEVGVKSERNQWPLGIDSGGRENMKIIFRGQEGRQWIQIKGVWWRDRRLWDRMWSWIWDTMNCHTVQVYLFSRCEITFTKLLAAQIFAVQHFLLFSATSSAYSSCPHHSTVKERTYYIAK
jgi:hypothetical protein